MNDGCPDFHRSDSSIVRVSGHSASEYDSPKWMWILMPRRLARSGRSNSGSASKE